MVSTRPMDRSMSYNSLQNDTFNARHKSSVEVAKDFIPPPQFNEILEFNNCILVGPRGSGKTTLLKMLQAPALASWYSRESSESADLVKFVGVFVAADVRWAKQLELITKGIDDVQKKALIHESAFSNFVNLSFVEAVQKSIQLKVLKPFGKVIDSLDRTSESLLARSFSDIWKTQSTPSFSALKHALRVQQSEIPRICSELASRDLISVCHDYPFIGLSWLNSLTLAIETINDQLGIEDQKWALLVDELEIIPNDLLTKILAPLRSTSSNLVFKYALSPTGAGSNILASNEESDPTQGNDFSPLTLWNTKKEDTRAFSTLLLTQALKKRGLIDADLELHDVLGWSGTAEEDEADKGVGETNRISLDQRKKLFQELADKDSSFLEYITGKGIDIDNLPTSDKSDRGTLVRKITPLVYLRNHVIKSWSSDGHKYRSKISYQPYFRYPNILDLTEGNPRWILNLAENLAMGARTKGQGIDAQGVQADAISSFKDRFISMLRVYPVGQAESETSLTPYDFLYELAQHIRQKIYQNGFSSDPALAFTIDRQSVEKFGDLISICIHLGALVLVDDNASKESSFIPGTAALEGRVVRICYRLAPEFFLPLRAGRDVRMNSALNGKKFENKLEPVKSRQTPPPKKTQRPLDKKDQLDLF